jgi:hypothetical protein
MAREARVLKDCKWHDVPFKSIKQGDIFQVYDLDVEKRLVKNDQGRNTFEALEDIREENGGLFIRVAGVMLT